MRKSEDPIAALLGLAFVLLVLAALGSYVVVRVRRDPSHLTLPSLPSLPFVKTRAVADDRSWLTADIGSLSIQDVNGDGFDDCVVWLMSDSSRAVRLQVIDGRSGRPGYGASTFGAQLAAISGTKLVYASAEDATPETPSQLVLVDLRDSRKLVSQTVSGDVVELFEVSDGFVARSPFESHYVDVKQDQIFITTASSSVRARVVGETNPTPEDPFVEQSLRRLRWDNATVERGVQRVQRQGQYWGVPRDRSYAHLAVLDQAELAHSWELDLADGVIAQLAVGRDLIGVVVHAPAANDQLLLIDLRGRRVAFRYQKN